jgi:hypothetical protein
MKEQTLVEKTTGYAGKAADILTIAGGLLVFYGALYEGYKILKGGSLTLKSGISVLATGLVGVAASKYAYSSIQKWDAVVVTTKVESDEDADEVIDKVTA